MKRVLLIDDNADWVTLWRMILRKEGILTFPCVIRPSIELEDVKNIIKDFEITHVMTDFAMYIFNGANVSNLAIKLGIPVSNILCVSALEMEDFKRTFTSYLNLGDPNILLMNKITDYENIKNFFK